MTYKVKAGHDVALVNLDDVSPQPTSGGIKPTRRSHAADGSVYDEAKYVELEFSNLGNVTNYQAVLTQFSILSATTALVTVYVRDETFAWVRMNGTAVQPEIGRDAQWRRYFPRNITILIKDLEASA